MKAIKYALISLGLIGAALSVLAVKTPTQELFEAINTANVKDALSALTNKADATSGLYRAIELNKPGMVEIMLKNGADVNAQLSTPTPTTTYQPQGYTPLEWAIFVRYNILKTEKEKKDNAKIITLLLEKNADPNGSNYLPLVNAIVNKDQWLIDLLVSDDYLQYLDLDIIDQHTKLMPLFAAARNKNKNVIIKMIEANALTTPSFIMAVEHNDLESLKLLVSTIYQEILNDYAEEQQDIDPNKIMENLLSELDTQGINPLMVAVQNNNESIVQWLLDQGAPVKYPEILFMTDNPNIIKMLIEAEPSIVQEDMKVASGDQITNYPVTMMAILRNKTSLALYLIKNNIGLDKTDETGNNALHAAVHTENQDIIKTLMKKAPELASVPNDVPETPYEFAQTLGKTDIVNLIEQLLPTEN